MRVCKMRFGEVMLEWYGTQVVQVEISLSLIRRKVCLCVYVREERSEED